MPTTVKIRRSGTASATPSSLEHGEIAINYADGKVFWKNASNVITSFTFQSYALASHTHSISDVTGLQTALDGKASSSHTHAASDITSGTLDIARIPTGTSSSHVCIGNDARLSDTRTPTDNTVSTAKIQNDAVTYAKIQNVSATSRILGRSSAGAGDVEELDAATARTVLSVQPTASPAFTGTASFGASVSVGTSSPTFVNANYSGVHIHAATATSLRLTNATTGQTATDGFELLQDSSGGAYVWNRESTDLLFGTAATTRLTISSTGTATFSGQVLVTAGSVSACSVAPSGDPNTGLVFPSADVVTLVTNGGERMRIAANGDAQIGGVNVVGLRYFDVRNTDSTLNSGSIIRLITRNASNTTDTSVDLLKYNNGLFAIVNNDNGPITLNTNGTERVRVDASGNVGIGTTSAAGRLHAYNGADATTAVLIGEVSGAFSNAADMSLRRGGTELGRVSADYFEGLNFLVTSGSGNAAVQRMRINTGGELMIGYTTDQGGYLLQVNSQIYATNATIATSDARFKTNIESLTDATNVIESLRPVAFDFIPQTDRNFAAERQVGLIAQEAQAALAGTDYADSVVAQCGDHLGLAYEKLVPVLIKALQESNARIAALEERLSHA